MKSLTIESCIPRMKAEEFLCFMKDPKSKARIVEEYQSLFMKEEEEMKSTLEQNKEAEIKGCLSYLQFVYYGSQSKKNQEIPRASFVDGYEIKHKFLCTKNPAEEDSEMFWQTVWDNQVEIIVMIGKLSETSNQYWSSTERRSVVSGKFKSTTREIVVHSYFTATMLTLTSMTLKRGGASFFIISIPIGRKVAFGFLFFIAFYGLGGSQVFCAINICIPKYDLTKIVSNVVERMRE